MDFLFTLYVNAGNAPPINDGVDAPISNGLYVANFEHRNGSSNHESYPVYAWSRSVFSALFTFSAFQFHR